MTTTLEVILEKITTAKRFADVFGEIHSSDLEQKLHELRKQYVYMVKFIHPDHMPKEEEKFANTVFSRLVGLYEQAKHALENDSYEIPLVQGDTHRVTGEQYFVFLSGSRKYVVQSFVWTEGDFSDIHLGKTENGIPVCVKIATDPTMNQYLEHEASLHSRIKKSSVKKEVRQFVSTLVDTVIVDIPGNKEIRANVFEYQEGYVSLTKIREVYPDGLDPRDAAWIWRRVLGQVVTAEILGVVHGAVVPDHTLVHPGTHDPLYIGWAHSIPFVKGKHARLTTYIDRWKPWYPKEVFDHKAITQKTDLYMAGKTMVYLLGGDVEHVRFPKTVPQKVQKIVQHCVEEDPAKRPENGHEVLEQFTDTIYTLWGKTYRQLQMPH